MVNDLTRRSAGVGLAAALLRTQTRPGFVDDEHAVARFKATLPLELIGRSYWPADAEAPDYSHLRSAPNGVAFDLTVPALQALLTANAFSPRLDDTKYRDAQHILFALRGCVLAQGQAPGVVSDRLKLTVARPDLRNPKCLVGVWKRLPDKALGVTAGLMAVPASTVPNADAVALQCHVQRQTELGAQELGRTLGVARAANLLPTGRYNYLVGDHGAYEERGCFRSFHGAFRLARRPNNPLSRNARAAQSSVPVLRAGQAPTVDLNSRWDIWSAFDNIHPAVTPKLELSSWRRGVRFSSEGCITIWDDGAQVGGPYGVGPNWSALRRAAGLTNLQPDLTRYYTLCLLTGAEAALAAEGRAEPRLRYGSEGSAVSDLQARLKVRSGDDEFGTETLAAWLAAQRRLGFKTSSHIFAPEMRRHA